jgi:D-alanyl-lipoteichoic acid acyltransferase DltB (MBOAT superfamily)
MLFNSYAFIFGFLPITLVGFFFLGQTAGARVACAWLAAASLFFYAWWAPVFLLLLIPSILVNAMLGRYLVTASEMGRRWGLTGGVVANLALLAYFKYAGFFVLNVNSVLSARLPVPHIVLPLGISFFTFQQIAYLSDSARGDVRDFSPVNYFLFVTFFPHLIAGPIVHHREMMPQFATPSVTRLDSANMALGLSLFTIGLFKKTVLADVSATWADPAFAAATGQVLDPAAAWIGALAFTFQLYFDFSAYSDMALGLARMFNIVLPLNFDSPYKAVNVIDFWRRWHMTLSRFLRDYLYFPLGGNRRGPGRRYANLLVVMVLGGLWHGAAWTFVAWGALHGVMLMVNRGWHALRAAVGLGSPSGSWPGRTLARTITFAAVVCAWVPFRAPDIRTASSMLLSMFGLNGTPLTAALLDLARAQVRGLAHLVATAAAVVRGDAAASAAIAQPELAGAWLLLAALIVFAAPNTYEIFRDYGPALVERTPPSECAITRVAWRPSWAWAVGLSLLFVASLLQLVRITPFLYFQF